MKFLFGLLFFFASATMSLAQYQVTLTTGATRNAETDDPIEVKLIGANGIESNWYRCDRPNVNDFEYGSSGTYSFSAPSMELSKIKIRLNGKDGWQFARASVFITDTKQSYSTGTQNVFFDNRHEQTFDLRKKKLGRYQITLITGQDNDKSGTDDPILIKLIGADGNETDWFRCDKPNHNDFERGSEDTYYFSSTHLDLEKIQIRLVGKDGWRFIEASVLLAGENQMYSTGKQNVLFDNSLNKTFTLERTPLVVAQNASIDVVANFEFPGEAKKIYFEKNGAPLHYHSIAGYRWQHLQDMIRLPDADGKQFYMGTFSQNCTNTEGGLVFVSELVPGETNGKVIWWDELNNKHKAGGFNHPGNLRRLGNTVVIAGQNWNGGDLKANIKSSFKKIGQFLGDHMKLGNGGQYVLFYDVSNPSTPRYMGKLNSCWNGQEVLTAYKDIDALTLSQVGEYYYLWYNVGKNSGIKSRSKILSPQASWELIEEGKDEGCSPLLFTIDGVRYAGGARFDKETYSVIYNQLQFAPGQDVNALTDNSEMVTRIDVKTSTFKPFSFGDGTTYTLNSLSNGRSSVVITDVESDSTINIAEIECND